MGNGFQNQAATNPHATVHNGSMNIAYAFQSTVLNGQGNRATGANAVVLAGLNNFAESQFSVVGSGNQNTVAPVVAQRSFIRNGVLNQISAGAAS